MTGIKRPELPPADGSCAMCGETLVPAQSRSVETQDYMLYFCGLDCYEKWRREREDPSPDDR